MDWNELKETIGDQARHIISADRANASDGNLNCVVTNHKKGDVEMQWFQESLHFFCHDCEGIYDVIDHCKYLAHDDMKEAHRILNELAGNPEPTSDKPFKASTPPIEVPVPLPIDSGNQDLTFPPVNAVEDILRAKAGHYLVGRGISRDTLLAYRVTSNENAIFFNYYVGEQLVKIKGRAIGNVANSKEKYRFTPKGGTNTLYGQHMFSGQRILVICEGEIDALSVHSAVSRTDLENVVLASSIPSGSSNVSWIENSMDFIKQFEAVVLLPDNDDAGEKFAEKASNALVMHTKVRIAKIDALNDINDVLQTVGSHAVCKTITNAIDYIPDFAVDMAKLPYKSAASEYERTGFFLLDKMIRGLGHNLVTLFTGHTGSGKTTIIRQIIIFNVMSGKRVGVMLGEESPVMSRDMIIRQSYLRSHPEMFQMTYDEWENRSNVIRPELIDKFNTEISPLISSFNCGHLQNKNRLQKIYEWIRFEASIYGTKLFIIDNMMKLEVGIGNDLNSVQADIIDAIKNMAELLHVHIILIAHPKKGAQSLDDESISGNQKIANTVDNLITFQRFDKMDEAVASKIRGRINNDNKYDHLTAFIRVHKNRLWGKLGVVAMLYDESTNCIHDLDPQNKCRYGWTANGRTYKPESTI